MGNNLEQSPHLNDSIDRFVAKAIALNRPLTLVNHATGPHSFDLLDDSERAVIDASMAQLREAAKGSEAATIEAATKTLANDTEAFAAQRMNASIARALAGRKVESL